MTTDTRTEREQAGELIGRLHRDFGALSDEALRDLTDAVTTTLEAGVSPASIERALRQELHRRDGLTGRELMDRLYYRLWRYQWRGYATRHAR